MHDVRCQVRSTGASKQMHCIGLGSREDSSTKENNPGRSPDDNWLIHWDHLVTMNTMHQELCLQLIPGPIRTITPPWFWSMLDLNCSLFSISVMRAPNRAEDIEGALSWLSSSVMRVPNSDFNEVDIGIPRKDRHDGHKNRTRIAQPTNFNIVSTCPKLPL